MDWNSTNTSLAAGASQYPLLEWLSKAYKEVHGPVSVTVCIFGVITNIFNVIVMTRPNLRNIPINLILMAIAIADLLTMMCYLPFAATYYIWPQPDTEAMANFILFHSNFTVTTHTAAIWLTVTVALFRFINIWKIAQARVLCNSQRAQLSIVLSLFVTIVICLPNYITHSVYPVAENNATNYHVDVSHLAKTHNFLLKTTNFWIQALFVKLLPCAAMVILCSLLIHQMRLAHKNRLRLLAAGRTSESQRTREINRTTGMLLSVVVLFTITELPQGILFVMNGIKTEFESIYQLLGDFCDIFALMNSAINFILYYGMSRTFRSTFHGIFEQPCQLWSGFIQNVRAHRMKRTHAYKQAKAWERIELTETTTHTTLNETTVNSKSSQSV